jgi:RIP metalloprotease RseP
VTETIDPSAGPALDAGESPARSGSWHNGVFVRDGAEPLAAPPEAEQAPESNRLVAAAAVAALVVAIVMWAGWWGLVVVGGLLISIILHEFGHYLTAKQAGMKVTEFFVGFGPKLFSFRRGETEYGLKPIPLGAYVRIIGMSDMEDVEPGDEGRTYREKSYWARLRVVLAGPFTNLAIAAVLLIAAFAIFSQPSNSGWRVASIVPGSAAAQAGLQAGDHLLSIDGQPVHDFSTVFTGVIQQHAGHEVTLVVDRDGQHLTLTPTIGWQLDDDGAGQLAPLQAGDKVVSVGGQSVQDYQQTRAALAAAAKGATRIEFRRNGYTYATRVDTPITLPAHGATGFLGISANPKWERLGVTASLSTAARTYGSMVSGSVGSLGHFFAPSNLTNYAKYVLTNRVPATSGSGSSNPAPIVRVTRNAPAPTQTEAALAASPANNRVMSMFGIVKVGSQEGADGGLFPILVLLALINIFLALLNLLPLLPFDGGHAAIATYEAIRGKLSGRPYRADIAKMMPVTYALMIFFAIIVLSSTYLDFVHPIHLPGQ